MTITISSTTEALVMKGNFDAVISIESPVATNVVRFDNTPHPAHLVLKFEDVDDYQSDIALPDKVHVRAALEFGRRYRDRKLLIHCEDGCTCSAAIALGILADAFGTGIEEESVRELLRLQPEALPNKIILDILDSELDRNGELELAWSIEESAVNHFSENIYRIRRETKAELIERSSDTFSKPLDITDTILVFHPHSIEPSKPLTEESKSLFKRAFR